MLSIKSKLYTKETLHSIPLFSELSIPQLRELTSISKLKPFKKNEIIFLEGDYYKGFYIILKGSVKIYKLNLTDIEKNANIRQTIRYANIDSFKEYKIGKSKILIDKIDLAIKDVYDLTDEEIKFIINYDIEFRTDEE